MANPVPLDVAAEIHELRERGFGINQIGADTGVNSSTVKQILNGQHKGFCDKLTTRQRQQLMNTGFQPKENDCE